MSENVTIIVQPQVQSVTVEVAQQVQEVTIEVGAFNGAGITDHTQLTSIGIFTHDELDAHLNSLANPHQVTKSQVGLSDVDNTSDALKPLSDATVTALGLKANTIHSHTISDVTGLETALDSKVDDSQVLTNVPLGALFTDTIYDDTAVLAHLGSTANPHNVTKSQVGLSNVDNTSDLNKPVSTAQQTALDLKVNNTRVLTDVPVGALFTDTIYDDSAVLKDSDTLSTVTALNKIITQSDIASLGGGDMTKAVYDTNNNGKVDTAQNAETVNGLTVETAVPLGALFTDTIYDDSALQTLVGTKLSAADINTLAELNAIITDANLISDTDSRLSDARNPTAHAHTIADVTGLSSALDGKVDDAQVLTNVPLGAVFTDTVYNDTTIWAAVNLNTAKISATGNELEATDLNTLAKINAIITDADLISSTDSRLTDSRTPTAHSHAISEVTGLQTALNNKVDDSQVLTNVPAGALFTDTIYNDADVLKDADALSPVTALNKLITQTDLAGLGGGDMLKSVYDTNNSGKVDDAEKVNGLTVLTAVPNGAIFTDTIYDDTALQAQVTAIEGDVTTNTNKLATIESGAEVNNISDLNAVDLTDGFDSTLHFHSADRNRANHTGTQTASTISDFDTEVANNTAVALNTAKISATGNELEATDINTLAKLNLIIGDTDLISTSDSRLSDARTPLAHAHAITDVTGLQTALNNKVDDSQVLTNVPAGALFTDTVYNDTAIWSAVNLNTAKVSFPGFATLSTDYGFTDNSTNWNTAFGWGNHASQGYLTAIPLEYLTQTEGDARYLQSYTETDPIFTAWNKSTGISIVASQVSDFDTEVANNTAVALNTAKVSYSDAAKVGLITVTQAVNLDTMESNIATNNAKISATGNELEPADIDTLAKLNLIITDADLISSTDSRLSDARTPVAHTHTASQITDFHTEVALNSAVALNTAKISYTDAAKVANISVTQPVNLDTMESDIAANNAKVTNATHTGDVTGATVLTIGANKVLTTHILDANVTLAKMANMATASLIYRKTAGAGVPEVQTLATLKTDLGLTGSNSGDNAVNTLYSGLVTNATHTGDVTGSGALTIASGVVGISKLANELKAQTLLGNVSGTVNIDWSLGIQWSLNMVGATTLTFSNVPLGKTITIMVTGNYVLTFPNTIRGDITPFNGTKTNQVQLYCYESSIPMTTISIIAF